MVSFKQVFFMQLAYSIAGLNGGPLQAAPYTRSDLMLPKLTFALSEANNMALSNGSASAKESSHSSHSPTADSQAQLMEPLASQAGSDLNVKKAAVRDATQKAKRRKVGFIVGGVVVVIAIAAVGIWAYKSAKKS